MLTVFFFFQVIIVAERIITMGLRILLAALTDPALGVDVNHKSHSRLSIATVSVKTLFYGLAPLLISLPPINIDIDNDGNNEQSHQHNKPIFHRDNECYISSRTIPQPSIGKTLFDTLAIAPTIYFCNRITLGENENYQSYDDDDEKKSKNKESKFQSPREILDRCPLLREIYIGEQRRLVVYGNDHVNDEVLNAKRRLTWDDDKSRRRICEHFFFDSFMKEYSDRNMMPQLEVLQINRLRNLTFEKHLFGDYKLLQNGSHLRVLNLASCRQLFSTGKESKNSAFSASTRSFFIFNELPKTIQELNLSGTGMRDDDVVIPKVVDSAGNNTSNNTMMKYMLPRLTYLDISHNKRLSSKSFHFICSRVAAFSLRTLIAKACGFSAARTGARSVSGDDGDDKLWRDIGSAQEQEDEQGGRDDEQVDKEVTTEFYDNPIGDDDSNGEQNNNNKTLSFTLADLPPSITEVDFSEGTMSRFLFAHSWIPKEEQENLFVTNLCNLRKLDVSNCDVIMRFRTQAYLLGLLHHLESFDCTHYDSWFDDETAFFGAFTRSFILNNNNSDAVSSSSLTSFAASCPFNPDELSGVLRQEPFFFENVKELKLIHFVPHGLDDSDTSERIMSLIAVAFPNITSLFLDGLCDTAADDKVLSAFAESDSRRRNLKCLTLKNLPGLSEDGFVKHVFEAYESLTRLEIGIAGGYSPYSEHDFSDAFLMGLAKSKFVRGGTLRCLALNCMNLHVSAVTLSGWTTLLRGLFSVETLILDEFKLPTNNYFYFNTPPSSTSSSEPPLLASKEELFANLHRDMPRLTHFEFTGHSWSSSNRDAPKQLLELLRNLDKCKHLAVLKIEMVHELIATEAFCKILHSKEMMKHLRVMDCRDLSSPLKSGDSLVFNRNQLPRTREGRRFQEQLYNDGKLDYVDRYFLAYHDSDDDEEVEEVDDNDWYGEDEEEGEQEEEEEES